MINVKKTIDEKTGEILYESKHHYVMFDEKKGYKISGNKSALYSFKTSFDEQVSAQDIGYMFMLARTIKDGFLSYRGNNTYKSLTTEKMASICSCSERTIKRTLNRLQKGNVIKQVKEEKEKRYYVNPIYFLVGKWISPKLYHMFKEDLIKVLPRWAIKELEQQKGELNG